MALRFLPYRRRQIDYAVDRDGVKGRATAPGFEYASNKNDHFLNVQEIAHLNSLV